MMTVNAMGDACPIPVVKTKKAMETLKAGDVVETYVDNEIAVENLTKMAKQTGCAVTSQKLDEGKYSVQIMVTEAEKTEKILETHKKSEEELLALFAQEFSLTPREMEVLACMLHSEDNVTEMATQLAISRAALYRHISNMNEKTNTKARIGLLQFYYAWMQEK